MVVDYGHDQVSCLGSVRTWRFIAPLGCLGDARYKHGTTAEIEHRHKEGPFDPLSGRDE